MLAAQPTACCVHPAPSCVQRVDEGAFGAHFIYNEQLKEFVKCVLCVLQGTKQGVARQGVGAAPLVAGGL